MDTRLCGFVALVFFLQAGPGLAQQGTACADKNARNFDPEALLHWWNYWGIDKEVTKSYPTDFQVGGIYRLRSDVVVEYGGTASKVSQYWVSKHEPREVQNVKEELLHGDRGNQSWGETRSLLPEGTRLRFQQIWLHHNFEMGLR